MVLQPANLSPRDRELLEALTRHVRVLSVEQIAAHWFTPTANPKRAASRRLRALEARGMIEMFSMAARPITAPSRPLIRWESGNGQPDFGDLARTLAQRWTQPAIPTACIIASAPAGTWLGGDGGRRPRRSEISHDLLLGAIHLNWRRVNREPDAEWISESRLRRLGFGDQTRLPDAIVDICGARHVVEIGGEYSAAKLLEFHEFCVEQGLSYELW